MARLDGEPRSRFGIGVLILALITGALILIMNEDKKHQPAASHPLSAVTSVPTSVVAALKSQWIETAEQVLALAASPQGREGLKKLLSFDVRQLEGLLSTLTDVVGPEQSTGPSIGMQAGSLGLVLTEEQKKRFGIK